MFQLDGQWIAGYIGVIGGLVAFVIGVSALIFQVALPSYLRTLTRRHFFRETSLLMATYLIAAILLIWVAPLSRSDQIPAIISIWVDGVMTILLITTIWYSIKHLLQINGDAIIDSLVAECKTEYAKAGKFGSTLETLIDIGAQSSAGFEKKRVLNALNALIEHVFSATATAAHVYDGTKLIILVGGFEEVLMGDVPGSQENYKAAAGILSSLIKRLCDQNRYVQKPDLGSALEACSTLGMDTVMRFSEPVTYKYIKAISNAEGGDRLTYGVGSRALRKIGIAALKCDKFKIATNAINEQITWDDENFTRSDEGTIEMLGLWAHLYVSGSGGAAYIRELIDREGERFHFYDAALDRETTVTDCLDGAIHYHFRLSHFDTHDNLRLMRDDLIQHPVPA